MGTRNLTMVVKDNEFKIAQYGQWDGDPSEQGKTVLEFLKKADIPEFIKKLDDLSFINISQMSESEIDVLNESADITHPHLSRDHGAKILELVDQGANELLDQHSFAGHGSCVWAYLIDFDNNNLEVYKGGNKDIITEGRFLSSDKTLERSNGYEPIILIKTYSLNSLPSLQKFVEDLTS